MKINTEKRYGKIVYPGRLKSSGIIAIAVESLLKYGFLTLGVSLFAIMPAIFLTPLLGEQLAVWVVPIYGLFVWGAVTWLYRSWKVAHYVDKGGKQLHIEISLLGRRLQSRSYSWPLSAFSGISYGWHALPGASRSYTVRLHGKHSGQYLLSFFTPSTRDEMLALADELSTATGLPLLEEHHTGDQHELDDMRLKDRWSF